MKQWAQKRRGFTIVELLIVVVVIAILAAITIVAYNGITNRAKSSAAQSAAASTVRKILAYGVENSEQYPTTLATLGIASSGDTMYQYSVNNSVSPRTFCVTATTGNVSYFAGNGSSNPGTGACFGHNLNGAPYAVNLLTNTSVETNVTNLQNIGNASDRTIARTASGTAYSGDYVLRITAGASGKTAGYGSTSESLDVGRYIGSFWIRANFSPNITAYFEGSSAKTTVSQSPNINIAPNTWTRFWRIIDITSPGTVKVGFLTNADATTPGNYVELDGFMLMPGDMLVNFADGYTPSWVWSGTVGGSTSAGPQV